jgi:hypothetical protein
MHNHLKIRIPLTGIEAYNYVPEVGQWMDYRGLFKEVIPAEQQGLIQKSFHS